MIDPEEIKILLREGRLPQSYEKLKVNINNLNFLGKALAKELSKEKRFDNLILKKGIRSVYGKPYQVLSIYYDEKELMWITCWKEATIIEDCTGWNYMEWKVIKKKDFEDLRKKAKAFLKTKITPELFR